MFNIEESQFGFYHCHVTTPSGPAVIKKALNYKGPYFGNLWDKYEKSVIISCSAAGGFLVLATALCCLYDYKYPDEDDKDDNPKNAVDSDQGEYNFALANEAYDATGDDMPGKSPGYIDTGYSTEPVITVDGSMKKRNQILEASTAL